MKHSLFFKGLYDIKFLLSLSFIVGLGVFKVNAQAPTSFAYEVYKTGFDQAVGSVFDAQNNLYVWEKTGRVWRLAPNQERATSTPLIDLSDEVYNSDDHGLLGFALDPQFSNNGYVYLWYAVERSVLYNDPSIPKDAAGATQGRCTRYTVNNGTVDLNSRKVLLGAVKGDGPPIMGITHGVGTCFFGNDGSLMLSVGDGSLGDAYGQEGISRGIITQEMSSQLQLRAQNINSFSGKLLRLNKETGEGISSNPYYDAVSPKSPKSIMYASGLRNPYRATCIPNTAVGANHPGFILVSDTGENTWEEVALYTNFGDNGGWPYYEGFDRGRINTQIAYPLPVPTPDFKSPLYAWPHQNNTLEMGKVGKIKVNGQPVLVTSLNNAENIEGTSSTANTFYPDEIVNDRYNNLLDNAVLAADYTQDKVRAILFNKANGTVDFDNPISIANAGNRGGVVHLQTNPYDGYIYAVDYPWGNPGTVYRLKLAGNATPVASIRTTTATSSATNNINIQLYGDQSYDADDLQLSYLWDFGDGQTSTLINPVHTFTTTNYAPEYRTVTLTVKDPHNNIGTTTLRVNLNNLPPVIPAIIIKDSNNNDVNSIGIGTGMPKFLNVTFDTNVYDDHDAANDLTYEWVLNRHHNSHVHTGSKITTKSGTFLLEPEGGCGEGATYWFDVTVKITDRNGAVSILQKNIYQNCTDLLQQTINVPPVANKYLSETSFALNGTSTSGLPVDYLRVSGPVTINALTGVVTLTGIPGAVEIMALQAGNAQYGNAYPVSIKFNIIAQPKITSTTEASRCGSGSVTLNATGTSGVVTWYNVETGGMALATGNAFTTNITQTTTFYVATIDNGVASARVPVLAKIAGRPIPFNEDFQGNGLPEGWTVMNTNDPNKTWLQRNFGKGNEATKKSFAYYNYYSGPDFVNNQVVEQDELRTPAIDLSRANAALLNFDLAYAYNNADDGLTVLVSTDCGYTFTKTDFEVKGVNLATTGNNSSGFYPNNDGEWKQCSVDLSAYIGNPNVIVAFRNTPAYGNNIYIDNVKVTNAVMAPVASFTASTNTYCQGSSVTYTSTSKGSQKTYAWTFYGGTPATSTEANPTVNFPNEGWTKATLVVTNSAGTSTKETEWIYVNRLPTFYTTTPASRCGTGSVNLYASATYNVAWYTTATGGTSISTSNNFTTPNLTNTTTYYVETNNNGCKIDRVPVIATIKQMPTIVTVVPASREGRGSVTLAATTNTEATVSWYDAVTGGNLLATGTSFVAPSIANTTTYYVGAANECGTSARASVTATINASACGSGQTLPISETFENGLPSNWTRKASLVGKEWAVTNVGSSNTNALWFNNYNDNTNEKDEISFNVNLVNVANPTFSFNFACANYSTSEYDELEILVSTDCGLTYTTIYKKALNENISTVSGFRTDSFFPTPSEWIMQNISLAQFAGQSNAIILFRNTPHYGNNLFIDNVTVSGGSTAKMAETKLSVETNVIETNSVVLSPNPNKGLLNINAAQSDIIKVSVFDMVGKLVFETNNENKGKAAQLNLAHLTDGVYVVIVNTTEKSFSKKIVIKK